MQYLFSPEGDAALIHALASRPILVFDFDGTLAPIVPLPDTAHSPPDVAAAMGRLSAIAPVAVISGRAVEDVRDRLGFAPSYLIGNHGAEGQAQAKLPEWGAIVEQWRDQLGALLSGMPGGVIMENKTYSLSLHYRLAHDQTAALRALREAVAQLQPAPVLVGGKCVLNLLAPGAPDKFDALAAIVSREDAGTAIFIGDDDTDEAVFSRAPAHWLSIRVERNDASAASFYINHQSEMLTFIQAVERRVRSLARGITT